MLPFYVLIALESNINMIGEESNKEVEKELQESMEEVFQRKE